ncbi:Serine-rich [Musa troglodytarum]|uniref:Serine-rich n=1 Tax=Musa troglodytarum TaxID=320322 RepID=A0A9E7H8K0_9LILI|nr:Serine-rich [Musa troglodytarum]
MAAPSYRGRYGGGRDHTHSSSLRRSISPSGGLRCNSASAFASSSASAFAASSSPRSSALLHRSASPTRVIFAGPSPPPRRRLQRWRRPEKDVHVLPDDPPGFVPLQTPQGHRRRRVVVLVAVYPAERAAVGDDELAGADRRGGGRVGAAVSCRPHPSLLPPAAAPRRLRAPTQPPLRHVQGRRRRSPMIADLQSRNRFPVDLIASFRSAASLHILPTRWKLRGNING